MDMVTSDDVRESIQNLIQQLSKTKITQQSGQHHGADDRGDQEHVDEGPLPEATGGPHLQGPGDHHVGDQCHGGDLIKHRET